MMRSYYWVGVVVVLLGSVGVADVPLRDYWGEGVDWHDGRSLAQAGVMGLEPGPGQVFGNPAALGFAARPAAALTYGLRFVQEERTRIVFDQFENALGEVAIADNIHANDIPGPVCGLYPWTRLVLGAGVGPVRDFNYCYLKEYRDDFYMKVGEDRVEQTGSLYSGRMAVAYRPVSWASLGMAAAYEFGRRELEIWTSRGPDTSHHYETSRPAGFGFTAGVVAQPVSRLSVGLDFSTGTKLAQWRRYPRSGRLALSYQVSGLLPSVVSGEARYEAWAGVDTTGHNILVVQTGVEHLMLNLVRLRYGFGVEPSPFDPSVQTGRFGCGVGFDVGKVRIDVGMLMTRDVIGPSLFREPLSLTDLKVYESRNTIAVTVARGF